MKFFESAEEAVSMFLGLAIVLVIVGLVFNFWQRQKGNVDIPGVSIENKVNNTITPTSTPEVEKGEYTVQKGDSLWKIAESKYGNGYKWVDIAQANKLSDPDLLVVGQKLVLSTTVFNGGEYVVKKGDSLWKIAVTNYTDGFQWPKIFDANKSVIKDANSLEVGMKIMLPRL